MRDMHIQNAYPLFDTHLRYAYSHMHIRHANPKCKCDMRDMRIVCISETHTRDAYPTCTRWSWPGGRRFVLGLTYIYGHVGTPCIGTLNIGTLYIGSLYMGALYIYICYGAAGLSLPGGGSPSPSVVVGVDSVLRGVKGQKSPCLHPCQQLVAAVQRVQRCQPPLPQIHSPIRSTLTDQVHFGRSGPL